MELKDIKISEMANLEYNCSCGRTHRSGIGKIDISENAVANAVAYISGKAEDPIAVICDENTYGIAGAEIVKSLEMNGCDAYVHIIEGKHGLNVAPTDACLGETLARLNADTGFFVAAGSGVINDITRQISYKMGKNYVVAATAPSMDGYASVTSSLILNDIKETIQGQYPLAIFGQTDILANAPHEMLTAGFGDVIGKYNALREWRFGRDYKGEDYCPEIAGLVELAVEKCRKSAVDLEAGDPAAVNSVMEALVTAGMAMGINGNTRPASGAEHHIVHYWDVDCIRRGVEHELHGNSVGIGTIVICRLFEMVRDSLPVETDRIDPCEIEELIKKAGGKTHPAQAGIDRRLFKESILKGHTMSSKYTVLTYLSEEKPDLLQKTAERLCEIYY
jgi:glycerol-1-phosphate dehydrogenase [NAD(P)+]